MDLNVDEIRALLEVGGYELRIYNYDTEYCKGWYEAIIYDGDLPQIKGIRSISKTTAVQIAYKFFIGETK